MPRHKEFSEEALLQTAILLFWEKGYCDASVDELIKRSGVAKYGIYATFGSKRALFKAVLNQYAEDRKQDIQRPLRKPHAALPEVLSFFAALPTKLTKKGFQTGCLMANTGMELGVQDEEFSSMVKAFFDETAETMQACLDRAVSLKQLDSHADTEILARFLINEFRTLLMLAASGNKKRDLKLQMETALMLLPTLNKLSA
ncbi:MAG: TetR/AcrR family transcriptional regulator [Candidatus Thiodiazotropha lotti]|nr:TetR/AcrR family transcriptional regulator [Candidatus Thiodiazotropha lotti]